MPRLLRGILFYTYCNENIVIKIKKARSRQNRPLLTYEKHQVYYQFITALLFLSITLITQNNSEKRSCKIE